VKQHLFSGYNVDGVLGVPLHMITGKRDSDVRPV
jgi:hypothetical protein